MTEKPYSEYAQRNGAPILEVLLMEFAASSRVLEIGSGTGQHAAQFAAAMPHLQWQTSDRDESRGGISARVDDSDLPNLLSPLSLDVRTAVVPEQSYDAVFSANTAHIMSFGSVSKMFSLVGEALRDSGVFCLYGPFRQDGAFNTASNAAFHDNLRSRDPQMGVRDLEKLDELGEQNAMQRSRVYAMPANNHLVVWQREER